MTLAILCSGQGRQHRDMFALTGEAPEAAHLFAHAATLLGGHDARELVRSETDEVLHHNRVGQILCTLQALAAASALGAAVPARRILAGYSVGEVAAWGIAGVVGAADTLDLVARRAEVMDAVSPPGDGMLFVRGLPRAVIDGLCARHEAGVAIVNPGDAFVLGGSRKSLHALAGQAKAMNAARVVDVPVEVASHTSRLAQASVAFRESLGRLAVTFPPPSGTRLLSGIDGSTVVDHGTGLAKLAAQLSRTVQWADCLQAAIEDGATIFLELGPGRALSEMVSGTYHGVPSRSLEDFRSLDGVRSWLASHLNA